MTVKVTVEVEKPSAHGIVIVDTYDKATYWLEPGDKKELWMHSTKHLVFSECPAAIATSQKERGVA